MVSNIFITDVVAKDFTGVVNSKLNFMANESV